MKFYTLTLTREQLHQVAEGLGMRIEHMQSDPKDYLADDIEAAKAALEHVTHVAWESERLLPPS
jgi:hypothetical protein